jgi:hypothetical protein
MITDLKQLYELEQIIRYRIATFSIAIFAV